MRLGRGGQCDLEFRNIGTLGYVMDRQIDKAVGLKRCESLEILDVREPIRVIRMAESYTEWSEYDDKTCRRRPII